MGQPGNLLAKLSSPKRKTLGHYRGVEHACNAGERPFITTSIFLVTEVIFLQRRKKKVLVLDRKCHDLVLTTVPEV